jgi:hypothetical protein
MDRAPVREAGGRRFKSCRAHFALVAQRTRAPGFGPGGWEFESLRGHSRGISTVGSAPPCHGGGRRFEPDMPLFTPVRPLGSTPRGSSGHPVQPLKGGRARREGATRMDLHCQSRGAIPSSPSRGRWHGGSSGVGNEPPVPRIGTWYRGRWSDTTEPRL